jgi:tetratricopeptide (TPR) repeat protein
MITERPAPTRPPIRVRTARRFVDNRAARERGGGRLSEEALIVLVAFGACGLLALGVAEMLWKARSRPAGSEQPPEREASGTSAEPVVAPSPPIEVTTSAALPVARVPRVHRTSALARHGLGPGRRPYVRRGPVPPDTAEPTASVALAEALTPARSATLLERCVALHQAQRHADAIALATAALQRVDALPLPAPDSTAALWGVVAQARQALGEHAEARTALQSAIAAAPEDERPTYQRQLAVLACTAARAIMADAAAQTRAGSEARLAAVEDATEWAECAAAVTPGEEELDALVADVRARLWPTYERTVVTLVQQQEFRAARRLLRQALADPRVTGEWVEKFHELFSTTFSGEIGQLTAQAIRGVQDGREGDALAALQRVETLLARLSDQALSPDRREEVGRRLSWGYRKLGERRLDAGDPATALDPLLRALDHEVDGARQRETHALLVRVLEAVTDTRAGDIRALAARGDRDAAIAQCESLSALLWSTAERGVPPADLAGAFAQIERVLDDLAR